MGCTNPTKQQSHTPQCIRLPFTEPSFFWMLTLTTRQNGRHFAEDTFNRIFENENVRISINFSLKFVRGQINNIPALVQIMAWRLPGDKPSSEPVDGAKPLSEPVMVSLLAHICVTRPQWVKNRLGSHVYWWNNIRMDAISDIDCWF